jgi:hypothetical protein
MSIKYIHNLSNSDISVSIGKNRVGTIKQVDGGFRYEPIGGDHYGDIFKTVKQVKKSLENDG